MKNLTKAALVLLTATTMSSAFAASENGIERVQSAKSSVEALTVTLENLGATVDDSVNLNGAYTFDQKEAAYKAKHAELQGQFDTLSAS